MDYSKVADVLHEVADNKEYMVSTNFVGQEYYEYFADALQLGRCLSAGWVTLTQEGRTAIRLAWQALCAMRGVDEETDFVGFEGWIQKQENLLDA